MHRSGRQLVPVFVHFCILAFLSVPVFASVDDFLGRPVASVRLVLDGRDTTDASFAQVVETKVGRPLSMVEVRESIADLFSLGRLDDVRVDASLGPDGGVALRYDLTPVHPVYKIEFTGNTNQPGIDVGELRRAVTDRYGPSPPIGRMGELAQLVRDTLQARGYRNATVTPGAEIVHDAERAILTFAVDPGPRTTVGTVHVAGTPPVSQADLLKRLRVTPGAPYEPDDLAARIASFIDDRRGQGYYEARVDSSVMFSADGRVADLTLTVEPGPRVRVVFMGDSLPGDRRADLVPIERDGSADEDLLEDSTNRIEEYLREQGYRDAIAPHTRQQTDNELVVTFNVHRGPLYRIDRLDITGATSIPLSDFQPAMRLREGGPYAVSNQDADVALIEGVYRLRGFTAVKAVATVESSSERGATQVGVVVRLAITEGPRTLVKTVRIAGNMSVPEATLRAALGLQPGRPYFDAQLRDDRDALQQVYENLGYRNASVESEPGFSADRTEASPLFTIREGPRVVVDHVLITGNLRTRTEIIERELQIKQGDPLSAAAVNASRARLQALGLFRRVDITELRHGDETTRDLLVTVEEAPPTTLAYGGGVEGRLRVVRSAADNGVASEKFEIAPRASFEIGRRNMFGKNRSINLLTSLSLHPKDSPFFANQPNIAASGGSFGFPEYTVQATYHEPRVLNTAFDGLLTGLVEQQIRSSFNFVRKSVTAQAARLVARNFAVSGSYQLQFTKLLDEAILPQDQPFIDQVFANVRLSSFLVSGSYDTRNDQLDPTGGGYLSVSGQVAGRRIGSDVGFAKSSFTAQTFHLVPHAHATVFAAQARLGLATGFPRDVVKVDDQGQTVLDPVTGQPVIDEARDLPEPERFFAGGDATVRGFALDTLGESATIKNGFPIGGNGLVIFNGELRVPVRGGFQAVGFVDTGNVFEFASDVSLADLRTAVGFGVRYKSPVGPLRFDMGFKVHRQPGEGRSAWFVSFGQAF